MLKQVLFCCFVIAFVASAVGDDNSEAIENRRRILLSSGENWRQSPLISLCNHPRYRQTPTSCRRNRLRFDSDLCKCIGDTRSQPINGEIYQATPLSALAVQDRAHVPKATGRDRQAFQLAATSDYGGAMFQACLHDEHIAMDPVRYQRYSQTNGNPPSFQCGIHLEPVKIPQPIEAKLIRFPAAILGVYCNGLPAPGGFRCVADKTFTQQVEVETINVATGQFVSFEVLELKMDESCHMAKVDDDCGDGKYRDINGICKCFRDVSECFIFDKEQCRCSVRAANNTEPLTSTQPSTSTSTSTTTSTTTTTTTASTSTSSTTTTTPVRPSTMSFEQQCLAAGRCAYGFSRYYDKSTGDCYCSCHEERVYSYQVCNGLMSFKDGVKSAMKKTLGERMFERFWPGING